MMSPAVMTIVANPDDVGGSKLLTWDNGGGIYEHRIQAVQASFGFAR